MPSRLLDLFHNPPRVVDIIALGDKDYGIARKRSGRQATRTAAPTARCIPHLFGMYQPDGIEAGIIGGRTYLFTANEGDARDYAVLHRGAESAAA